MERKVTGERLETFIYDESAIEHLHRYAIAMDFAKDKHVLDIACGEGYGAHLLSAKASSVLAVDKDQATIAHAKKKYTSSNLQFTEGLAQNIPAEHNSFDLVVSFETLEHINDHEKMFQEIKRVLKPGGTLIISTPDKKNYSDNTGYRNSFHLKELYEDQFAGLVNRHFTNSYFIYQRLLLASIAQTRNESEIIHYKGNYEKIISQKTIDPVYIIAIASDAELQKPSSSIFAGESILQSALDEKEKALKSTTSYRLGHSLLYPFKLLRNAFKK